ncbi:hypothetical protein FRX31_034702 [Thalictrum thalictroides]|uniref:Uncharacterized protein n=1 Tax=Thalictrum thalictroides TaxID=46969 RepID=A0A7J6UT00_THATH|nr:hypothetical protein FRX31_034702 [Thalictrum thalictroides]
METNGNLKEGNLPLQATAHGFSNSPQGITGNRARDEEGLHQRRGNGSPDRSRNVTNPTCSPASKEGNRQLVHGNSTKDNNNAKGNAKLEHTADFGPNQANAITGITRVDIIGDNVKDMDRGDKHGLGQFHIDTLNEAYGLHSPTKKSDCGDKLMMILKGKNVQEDKEHIQAIWIQKKEGQVDGGDLVEMKEGTSNASPNEREQLIAMVEQHENCEDSTKATQEEGWETPKRRHTCRAKGINQVSNMQVIHNQENEDYQGPCTRDTGQDHSSPCLKGVELGLGLDPSKLSV